MARAYLPSLTFFPVSFSTPVIHTPTLRCSFATSRSNRPHSIHSVVSVASTEPRFYVDIAPPFFCLRFRHVRAHVDLHFPCFAVPGSVAQTTASLPNRRTGSCVSNSWTDRTLRLDDSYISLFFSFFYFEFLTFV